MFAFDDFLGGLILDGFLGDRHARNEMEGRRGGCGCGCLIAILMVVGIIALLAN